MYHAAQLLAKQPDALLLVCGVAGNGTRGEACVCLKSALQQQLLHFLQRGSAVM